MTGPFPAEARLLRAAEVTELLNISSSTLQSWRQGGSLEAVPLPKGGWRYPSTQPLIQRALEALGRCTAGVR